MNKKLVGLAVAATLSLTAFAASAEDMFRDAWYVVPGINYMHADNDLDAKNSGYGASIKLGKELSPSWDLQGGLGYNTARADAGAIEGDTGIAGSSGRYKQITLGLDALYMFSRSNFRPFLLAGVGAARNKLDYNVPGVPTNGSKTSWLGNVGLGAQYLFNDNFGLQADLREQWSRAKLDAPSVGFSEQKTVANTSVLAHQLQLLRQQLQSQLQCLSLNQNQLQHRLLSQLQLLKHANQQWILLQLVLRNYLVLTKLSCKLVLNQF
jgi:OmpA-OmpF porin, OOP family